MLNSTRWCDYIIDKKMLNKLPIILLFLFLNTKQA